MDNRKNLLAILALLIVCAQAWAYDSTILTNSLDATTFQFNKAIRLSDGNYLAVGEDSVRGALAIKFSPVGNVVWKHIYGSRSFNSVVELPDQSLVFAGFSQRNFAMRGSDVLIVRAAADGTPVWTREYGGLKEDIGRAILAATDSGSVFVAGTTTSFVFRPGQTNAWILRVDLLTGSIIWETTYDNNSTFTQPNALLHLDDGFLLVVGEAKTFINMVDEVQAAWLAKIDPATGVRIANRMVNRNTTSSFTDVVRGNPGTFTVVGLFPNDQGAAQVAELVSTLDPNIAPLFSIRIQGFSNRATSIARAEGNVLEPPGYLIGGRITTRFIVFPWMARMNDVGLKVWEAISTNQFTQPQLNSVFQTTDLWGNIGVGTINFPATDGLHMAVPAGGPFGVNLCTTPLDSNWMNNALVMEIWQGAEVPTNADVLNPANTDINPNTNRITICDHDQVAFFDTGLSVPSCVAAQSSCDSTILLTGRGNVGPEQHAPNTIRSSCTDGSWGTFHSDESIDRIRVTSLDGTNFQEGKDVLIEIFAWVWSASADHLDVYYATDANNPIWQYLTTLEPFGVGSQVFSTTYTLPPGGLQAIRANFRYLGWPATCTGGGYDDHDDLVFAVSPPACSNSSQLLMNPGFESGGIDWSATPAVITNSTARTPHTGDWYAWLDGYGTTHTDTLSQTVSIPSNACSAQLSFWLKIDTAETTTVTPYDTLKIQLLDSAGNVIDTLATYSNLDQVSIYVQRTFDLNAYKGQTVTIRFYGVEDYSLQTSFLVDDVAINILQ